MQGENPGDLPDEMICAILWHVPLLWRPLALRVSHAWRRCAIEIDLAQECTNEKWIRATERNVPRLTMDTIESREALSRPPFIAWTLEVLKYPHVAWLVEAAARHGLADTVCLIAAHVAEQKGTMGLLDMLDGGVLANIALYCNRVPTLRRLCARHRIGRLDRRNMAWAVTVATVAGDTQVLRFLARMGCPYDITTALAVHLMDDAHTARLFGIAPEMLCYATDIVRRTEHAQCPNWYSARGCLLTRLAILLRLQIENKGTVLTRTLLDGKHLAAILSCPIVWYRACGMAEDRIQSEVLGMSSLYALVTGDVVGIGSDANMWRIPCIMGGSIGPLDPPCGGTVCNHESLLSPWCPGLCCTSWECCGSDAFMRVYDTDTVGSGSVADPIWIPPLFQRWHQRVPGLKLLFRCVPFSFSFLFF